MKGTQRTPTPAPHPLQPRKGLLVALGILYAGWLGAMLAMYLVTVR